MRVIQHKNDDPNAGMAFTVRIQQKDLMRVPFGLMPIGCAPDLQGREASTLLMQLAQVAKWLELDDRRNR